MCRAVTTIISVLVDYNFVDLRSPMLHSTSQAFSTAVAAISQLVLSFRGSVPQDSFPSPDDLIGQTNYRTSIVVHP